MAPAVSGIAAKYRDKGAKGSRGKGKTGRPLCPSVPSFQMLLTFRNVTALDDGI